MSFGSFALTLVSIVSAARLQRLCFAFLDQVLHRNQRTPRAWSYALGLPRPCSAPGRRPPAPANRGRGSRSRGDVSVRIRVTPVEKVFVVEVEPRFEGALGRVGLFQELLDHVHSHIVVR